MSDLLQSRNFSQQWRHCYLLLLVIFWVVWRMAPIAIPRLENTRIMGGLHPIEVLLLMDMLRMMWLPPLLIAGLYALSFAIRPLNTAEAIAGSALCSSAILALGLILALIRFAL